MDKLVSLLSSSVMTALIYLVGGFDLAMQIFIIFIVLDIITGVTKACINGELSSRKGFKGFLTKILKFIAVIVGVALDRLTLNDGTVRNLVIYYFVANEGISIVENLALCGVPMPKQITAILESLKEEDD